MVFPLPLIVDNFPNHSTVKSVFLQYLEDSDYSGISETEQSISKSDWLERSQNNNYSDFIVPLAIKAVSPYFDRMNYSSFANGPIWFQQYVTNNYHGWHRHANTDWGFVYYLELPEDGPVTEFRNPLNRNEIYTPNAVEGQFVLFPTILEHRSSVNKSLGRKTVIVLNFKAE